MGERGQKAKENKVHLALKLGGEGFMQTRQGLLRA